MTTPARLAYLPVTRREGRRRNMAKPVCVVAGVGPGNGAAFARRFDSEGYSVALLARGTELPAKLARELSDACAYACDVADAASVARAFEEIRRDLDRKSTRLNSSHLGISYAVFCLKK